MCSSMSEASCDCPNSDLRSVVCHCDRRKPPRFTEAVALCSRAGDWRSPGVGVCKFGEGEERLETGPLKPSGLGEGSSVGIETFWIAKQGCGCSPRKGRGASAS